MPTRDLLNLREVATLCGVSRQAVWYWIRHGRLPAHQVHREWVVERAEAERAAAARQRRKGAR